MAGVCERVSWGWLFLEGATIAQSWLGLTMVLKTLSCACVGGCFGLNAAVVGCDGVFLGDVHSDKTFVRVGSIGGVEGFVDSFRIVTCLVHNPIWGHKVLGLDGSLDRRICRVGSLALRRVARDEGDSLILLCVGIFG